MVGIFITARLGSTRLNQKHLIEIEGKPMIKWLVDRFDFGFKNEIIEQKIKIFITTSDNEENRLFETVFENSNVKMFYGSNSNIPLRHLQCARAHNIDYILSVDGDDILCSIEASKIVLEKLINKGNLVKTTGLPLGMNVMGYTTTFLESSLSANTQETLETGWGKIFDQKYTEELEIENYFNCDNIRMTLDYNEDAIFFSNVIKGISEDIFSITDKELISKIIKYKWHQINESLNNKYWENFNSQKKSEN